jgi:hypothetical protein
LVATDFIAEVAMGAGVGASMATGVGVVACTVATVVIFFATALEAADLVAGAGEFVILDFVFFDALMWFCRSVEPP